MLSLLLSTLLTAASAAPHQHLPAPVLAGYTNQASVDTILTSVDQGVNVLIWSFIELTGHIASDPVQGGPDPAIAKGVAEGLAARNVSVVHLMSYGGWGAPHPDTTFTGAVWWELFQAWDKNFTQQVGSAHWHGFDGVDCDAEGSDDPTDPANTFSPELIKLLGTFSQAAKAAGYLSTMVPPQSYLDAGTSAFDPAGSVLHADSWAPDFPYHGMNTYAPLIALYGDSYDLVMIQIYEGYSRAGHMILDQKVEPSAYIAEMAQMYTNGWEVDFAGAFGLPQTMMIRVPVSKLVIGLGNKWAIPTDGKFLYIDGDAAGSGYDKAGRLYGFRGFGFWDIADDDATVGLVPKLAKHLFA